MISSHTLQRMSLLFNVAIKAVILFESDEISWTPEVAHLSPCKISRKKGLLDIETGGQLWKPCSYPSSWWRQQMKTFSSLLALCTVNSPVTGEFLLQRPVTLSFDVLYALLMDKLLSKPSGRWCIESPSRSLWRHCNVQANTSNQ